MYIIYDMLFLVEEKIKEKEDKKKMRRGKKLKIK